MSYHSGPLFVGALTLLVFAAGIVFVGHLAYRARIAREEAERAPPAPPVEGYVAELRRLNVLVEQRAAEARETLLRARETVRRGVKG